MDTTTMDTTTGVLLSALGWEVRTGYEVNSLDGSPISDYDFVVVPSYLKPIKYVRIKGKEVSVCLDDDDTDDLSGEDGPPFYGWGSTLEEAVMAAGYYLLGYLH